MTTHKDLYKFNVLCVTDAKGRRYARGYKNVWVPAKDGKRGHSKMGEQIYIGAVKDNGLVKMGPKFLEKYPAFAGRNWYFERNVLYSEDAWLERHPEMPTAGRQEQTSDETQAVEPDQPIFQHFGATYALSMMARSPEYAIKQSLDAAIGQDKSEAMLGQVMYSLLGGGAASSFEDWSQDHYLPAAAKISGQRISDLFRSISQDHIDSYFKDRFERSLKADPDSLRYCALDSTSVPVSSASNPHAEYGHAKSDGHLPQVNIVVVMDRRTGDIVYACEYNGSINDVASFTYVCDRMKRIGIDLSKICFAVDRGYDSNFNQDFLVNSRSSFVMGRRIPRKSALRDFLLADRKDPSKNLMSSTTLITSIERHVTKLTSKVRRDDNTTCDITTYLYRDPIVAAQMNLAKRKQVDAFVLRANKQDDDGSFKLDPEYREVKDFMVQREVQCNGPHKQPEKRWFAHNGRLSEYERTVGCFAISTNMDLSAEEAFEHYKQRNIIEVGFRAFKDGTRDRLHTSVCGYWGKLLCYLLAEAFVMSIRKNAQDALVVEGSVVSLPHNSVPEMLRKLETVHISRRKPTDRWLVHKLTRQQRGYMRAFFKIKTPPQHL